MNVFSKTLAELDLPKMEMVSSEMPLSEVLKVLNRLNVGVLGVTDESNKLVGVVSERDMVLRTSPQEFSKWNEVQVSTIMSKKIFYIDSDKLVSDAVQMMSLMEFRHLPLKKDDAYYIISARDILDMIAESYEKVCSMFGTLVSWETDEGQIHEESHIYHNQEDSLHTGSFLFASMKEVDGSEILKIDEKATINDLWLKMKETHLPVAAVTSWSTILMGIITERDLMTKVFTQDVGILSKPISGIMTPNPHSMMLKHHLVYAVNNMSKFRYRNILVVDEDKYPMKIAELIDFLKFFSRVLKKSTP